MKIIRPYYEILNIGYEDNQLEKIEKCGRVCYQSSDKITEDSNIQFVKNIVKREHYSVLEHASLAISCSERVFKDFNPPLENKRFFTFSKKENDFVICGNFRAWFELISSSPKKYNEIQHVLLYFFPEIFKDICFSPDRTEEAVLLKFSQMDEDELYIHYRPTVVFIADRGFLAEIRTHRDASFSVESTRYCLYSNEKFGKEITVIEPFYYADRLSMYDMWKSSCQVAEDAYMTLIENGSSPQEARSVLPTSLKTQIAMTANYKEWEHVFKLRTDVAAHPQMRQLMEPLKKELFT